MSEEPKEVENLEEDDGFNLYSHDDGISLHVDVQGNLNLIFIDDSLIALTWPINQSDCQSLESAGGQNAKIWQMERRSDGSLLAYLSIRVKSVSPTYVKVKLSSNVEGPDEINANVSTHYHYPVKDWQELLNRIIAHFEQKK